MKWVFLHRFDLKKPDDESITGTVIDFNSLIVVIKLDAGTILEHAIPIKHFFDVYEIIK